MELRELREILRKSSEFFEGADAVGRNAASTDNGTLEQTPLLESRGGGDRGQLGFITGVIQRDRVLSFERVLWRACRGNVFLRQVEIEEEMQVGAGEREGGKGRLLPPMSNNPPPTHPKKGPRLWRGDPQERVCGLLPGRAAGGARAQDLRGL